jgi:hypothetical protein
MKAISQHYKQAFYFKSGHFQNPPKAIKLNMDISASKRKEYFTYIVKHKHSLGPRSKRALIRKGDVICLSSKFTV